MKAWLLLLAGCYSASTLGRAHTLGENHFEAFVAPEAMMSPAANQVMVRPTMEIGMRYGLLPKLDMEARLTTLGAAFAARAQIRRGSDRWGIDVLAAPGVQYTWQDKVALQAPVLFGLNVPGDHQIIFAPRGVWQMRFAPGVSHPVNYLFLGASVGFAWRVTRHFSLLPELAFLTQIYADTGFASAFAGGVGIQGSLGVLLDW